MNIYVASSWRNTRQPLVVEVLRMAGHEVYDFKNPPSRAGFGWEQVVADQIVDPRKYRDEVLQHSIAQKGFESDFDALVAADATVLVLPCGRSAHLELGYATGMGQKTLVLLDEKVDEPELMYLMNTYIALSLDEAVDILRKWASR